MPTHPDLIDRRDLVLVVIDMQLRLAATMDRRASVSAAASKLVRTAALLGAPVVVTRQYPAGLGDTVDEIACVLAEAARTADVRIVDKTAFCACREPRFLADLEASGRRQIVVVGMETHICVAQTALDLAQRGYRVHVPHDACCSRRPEDHEHALARLRAQAVTVTTSESVMYEAVGRAGTDEFRRMLAIVKEG